jgi:hypothetical protein
METRSLEIYFSDLNSEVQKKLLETAEASDPKEYNWDVNPLITVFFNRDPFPPHDDIVATAVGLSRMKDPLPPDEMTTPKTVLPMRGPLLQKMALHM